MNRWIIRQEVPLSWLPNLLRKWVFLLCKCGLCTLSPACTVMSWGFSTSTPYVLELVLGICWPSRDRCTWESILEYLPKVCRDKTSVLAWSWKNWTQLSEGPKVKISPFWESIYFSLFTYSSVILLHYRIYKVLEKETIGLHRVSVCDIAFYLIENRAGFVIFHCFMSYSRTFLSLFLEFNFVLQRNYLNLLSWPKFFFPFQKNGKAVLLRLFF